MTINLSNGLAGLSLLTGGNLQGLGSTGAQEVETRAVRQARAQFTTPVVTPPWKTAAPTTPIPVQVSAIKRMATIIDKATASTAKMPKDVATAFTTYKALDRLRLLAETAVKTTTGSSERMNLQATFARGLEDLKTYLASAPSDKLILSFDQAARRAESVAITSPASLIRSEVLGRGILETRDAPLPGLTGTEVFKVTLSMGTSSDVVTVDLAGTPQSPTIDSVAAAINAAIATVPKRNPDGTVVLDAGGTPVPRWGVSFTADKNDGKWGFAIQRGGSETVAIDQVNAGDALMVASGLSSAGVAVNTRILRFDDLAGAMDRSTLGTLAALDAEATERAQLLAAAEPKPPASKDAPPPAPIRVNAPTTASGIATDAQGFSYVVGTTSGAIGGERVEGSSDDLMLTKLDSEGRVVWQRSLGAAGSASGAAVSIAPDGGIVVAGTVTGGFDGTNADGDMLVAKFDAKGDEQFAKLVRSFGADQATAVTVAVDGSIFVGGRAATGGGDAFVARLDATGVLKEHRSIDSGGGDTLTALAIDGSGALLALTREGTEARLRRLNAQALATDLGQIDLGAVDARALAVADDGAIAVGGAATGQVTGIQANSMGGSRDGFVARIDAGLTSARVTYLATGGEDQVDSVAFLDGAIYAGGRTTGALDATPRTGKVDGFVSRIDAASGTIQSLRQFGQADTTSAPVHIAVASGGDTVLGALGLNRGVLTPTDSPRLTAGTGLRPGDEFSIRVAGGTPRRISITAEDTLATLADRIRRITGTSATVATPREGATATKLRIEAKPGVTIELIAGAEGKDALAKLGLPEARIAAPPKLDDDAPSVRPGGNYGLDLTEALSIGTAKDAKVALARVKQAISFTQTGYRSLYWDDAKAALANGGTRATGGSTKREQAQLAQYQAALDRLSSGAGTLLEF